MKNYSKHFLIFLAIAVLVVVGHSFLRYKVSEDFILTGAIECDIESESCFIADCSPEDPECDLTPYKKIQVDARNAPSCLYENDCENFVCVESGGCVETLCSEESHEDGEQCSSKIEIN